MGRLRTGGTGDNLLVMLGSGVAAVLLTRGYLQATGYPRVGGGGLHIAHVLWGGLLMVAALGVALTRLGHRARLIAAVLGGAGFGLFIDEVGKFVTERTDYFYRPAAGLIYLAFAVLAVITFRVRDRPPTTSRQRTAEAANLAVTGLTDGLTDEQHAAAMRLIGDSESDVDVAVRRLLDAAPRRTSAWPARLTRARALLTPRVRRRLTAAGIGAAVVLPLLTLAGAAGAALSGDLTLDHERGATLVMIAAAALCAVLGIRAAAILRRDRGAALRLLRTSLLVDLLIAQVFKFTVNQFAAVAEAALTLTLLLILRRGAGTPDRATARRS